MAERAGDDADRQASTPNDGHQEDRGPDDREVVDDGASAAAANRPPELRTLVATAPMARKIGLSSIDPGQLDGWSRWTRPEARA